ncbi:hypothetical protein BDW75DRAFT_171544 [Aspergillus navahoensis]
MPEASDLATSQALNRLQPAPDIIVNVPFLPSRFWAIIKFISMITLRKRVFPALVFFVCIYYSELLCGKDCQRFRESEYENRNPLTADWSKDTMETNPAQSKLTALNLDIQHPACERYKKVAASASVRLSVSYLPLFSLECSEPLPRTAEAS